MAKLILDDAAMQLAMRELAGRPIHAGPGGRLLAPGVIDIMGDDSGHRWRPANARTRLLVLGTEACRDVAFHAPPLANVNGRARAVKALTVPVCSLMDVVSGLLSQLNDKEWQLARRQWPSSDQDTYKSVGRRLRRKRLTGPVRKVRNKLGAHLDPCAFDDKSLRLPETELLGAMGDALVLLVLALNHPARAFSWVRYLGKTPDGKHECVETMFDYPACVCWLTGTDGHVERVGPIRLAADPRQELQRDIWSATTVYNQMVALCGDRMPRIRITPMDAPLLQPSPAPRVAPPAPGERPTQDVRTSQYGH
jgi:hypothetical protein